MSSVCLRTFCLHPSAAKYMLSPATSPVVIAWNVDLKPSGMPPFPDLPSELVIHILEFAAQSCHAAAKSISLVSTWARQIALPYLFRTVVYRSKPAYSSGMTSGARGSLYARTSRPHAWGPLVRNLWAESSGINNASNEEEVFRACPNVENLAIKSTSLRALTPSIQAQTAKCRKAIASGSSTPTDPFPARLRSLTLITHTFRYDWHFLLGRRLADGSQLLHNITHLRLLDMKVSSFSPHNLLPSLTHLALPYLDLGNDFKQDVLRLPQGLLEHRSLRMIVLTVAEESWLTNPWYQIARYPGKATNSPKMTFRTLVQWVRAKDDRLHAVLSPRLGDDPCKEWVDTAHGGASLWEMATEARAEDSHGAGLPETYPKGMRR
ncbi:hypothetical protein C8Q76DRAFT_720375 [Earliella scabrosa]|nr:hypothetical protein C8Q76DRAFT_720375 [Earliella scabrosa]